MDAVIVTCCTSVTSVVVLLNSANLENMNAVVLAGDGL